MTVTAAQLIAPLVVGAAGWILARIAYTYSRLHGAQLVTCPETGRTAAVAPAAWRAAVTSAVNRPRLQIRDCSRWRERAPCGQPCVKQIEAAPERCRVLAVLSRWYENKACTCCGRNLGPLARWRRKPCVMSPDLHILEWKDIRTESIPAVLGSHVPVCRTCLVADTHTL